MKNIWSGDKFSGNNFTCTSFVQVGNQKTAVSGAAGANVADNQQRKTGTDKAYPQSVLCSLMNH